MPKCLSLKENGKYDDYEVRDALRALTRAEEIKQDNKMMKLVKTEAENQQKAATLAVKTADEYQKLSSKDKGEFIAS